MTPIAQEEGLPKMHRYFTFQTIKLMWNIQEFADAGGRKQAWSEKPHGNNTRLVAPHGK
jgi:hypothetical protein